MQRWSRMVDISKLRTWTRMWRIVGCEITRAELCKTEPNLFKFLFLSVYDILLRPANSATWGLLDTPACQL